MFLVFYILSSVQPFIVNESAQVFGRSVTSVIRYTLTAGSKSSAVYNFPILVVCATVI